MPNDDLRRGDVITGVARRRCRPAHEKLRIIEESLAPGESVSALARRDGVARNLLFRWHRLMDTGVPWPWDRRNRWAPPSRSASWRIASPTWSAWSAIRRWRRDPAAGAADRGARQGPGRAAGAGAHPTNVAGSARRRSADGADPRLRARRRAGGGRRPAPRRVATASPASRASAIPGACVRRQAAVHGPIWSIWRPDPPTVSGRDQVRTGGVCIQHRGVAASSRSRSATPALPVRTVASPVRLKGRRPVAAARSWRPPFPRAAAATMSAARRVLSSS